MDLISLDDDQPPQEQQQQLSTQENEMKEQAQVFQSAEVCSLCVFVYLACACAHVCSRVRVCACVRVFACVRVRMCVCGGGFSLVDGIDGFVSS